jgi:hypothetical protein
MDLPLGARAMRGGLDLVPRLLAQFADRSRGRSTPGQSTHAQQISKIAGGADVDRASCPDTGNSTVGADIMVKGCAE